MEECDLRGVRKITEASLTKFVYEARKLKKLDVRGCQGTTICVSSQFYWLIHQQRHQHPHNFVG
jgi:hypothetical protein